MQQTGGAFTPRWEETATVEAKGREVVVWRAPGAHAATVTDATLLLVVEALEAGGCEHFLIERGRDGSRVAVAGADEGLWRTLTALGDDAPLYATVRGRAGTWHGLARDLPQPPPVGEPDRVVLHVAVRDPISGLKLGRDQGCAVELWREDGAGGLTTHEPNPTTQEVSADDRGSDRRVEVAGRRVRIVTPFDRPRPFEVRFDVDAVILWVDGADARWRAAREERRAEVGLVADDPGAAERLYADHGELRYLLRSLERFAPWLRRLFLVTAGQRPSWLVDDHPWLTMVDHRDLIEPAALPVFSPRPVTARMHRIEGLAEHFLYFNDDMILARSVPPERFFTSNGLSKLFLSKATVPRRPHPAPHHGARQVMQELIEQRYGVRVSQTFRHAPYPLRRSTLRRLHEQFSEHLDATVHRPFRSPQDVVPEWLHHYVALLEGRAVTGHIPYGYYPVGRRAGLEGLSALLTERDRDCFCLNDQGDDELSTEESERWMLEVLEQLLPGPSTFERDGGGSGRGSASTGT